MKSTGSPFIQALGENEVADSFLQWTLKKSAKGNFWGSSCNAHQFSFPRQFQVYCKAVRAALPALQGMSRLLRLKRLKNTSVNLFLVTEYVAPLPCNTTNITEIQIDLEKSLELTLQEKKQLAFGYMWAVLAAFNCHAPTSDGAV